MVNLMAGVYHWDRNVRSASGAILETPIPPVSVTIPAGGVLKKFVLIDSLMIGEASHRDYNSVGTVGFSIAVDYQAAGTLPRNIYRSSRRVPTSATALYDPLTAERIYTAYWGAGDNELGVDQQCSYGKSSDLFPATVTAEMGWTGPLHLVPGTMDGYYQLTVAFLYHTLT
jgi:hypothetical protein